MLSVDKRADPSARGGLWRSTFWVSGMTLLSRVSGFVRDVLVAHVVGAGSAYDAFVVAFKIPNFFRRLFAEGAFSQAFVPLLSSYQLQHSQEDVRDFLGHVWGVFTCGLVVLTGIMVWGAPGIIRCVASGFVDPQQFQLAVSLLRWMLPYLVCIAWAGWLSSVLNTYGVYGAPAVNPVWLNVCLVVAMLVAGSHGPAGSAVWCLAGGVLAGGVLQCVFLCPFVYHLGLYSKPRCTMQHPGVQQLVRRMVPALFGVAVAQINFFVDTMLASHLPAGSISWLFYADRLLEFPVGLLGVALATVVLPHVSRYVASGVDHHPLLHWSLRVMCVIIAPPVLAMWVLSEPLVFTLFQHGALSSQDAWMIARAVTPYAVAVPALVMIKLLAAVFYAHHNLKTPVMWGVVAMISHLVMSLAWMQTHHHVGLAWACALGAWVNAVGLICSLRRLGALSWSPVCTWVLGRVLVASAVLGGVWTVGLARVPHWAAWTVGLRVVGCAVFLIGGVLVYALVLYGVGVRVAHLKEPHAPV